MRGGPTVSQAILAVMKEAGDALYPHEVYRRILEQNLYEFHAQKPEHVVKTQIRRHCKDLDFPTAEATKYFGMTRDGKFFALESPLRMGRGRGKVKKVKIAGEGSEQQRSVKPTITSTLRELKELQRKHQEAVKARILRELKKLAPTAFEHYAKRLMEVYGFEKMRVTSVTRDGGVDGYGLLKIGLAFMRVAFQCKRWATANVGRPEIDKFRGAIQGAYEQGIFFTTAMFASGAKAASLKPGAVPVILIDGPSLVDLMFEKGFGVEQESLPIYTYALDVIISGE